MDKIDSLGKELGTIIGSSADRLVVVFNYTGMLKIVGDSFKK